MPVKLIIFDLDGTLVDSSIDLTHALNYALQPYAFAPLTVNDTIRLVGEGITRLIENLVGDVKPEITEDVKRRFLEYYTAHIIDYTRAYPEVKETLEKLSGYRKAVISNKREALSKMVLEGLGLSGFFELIVGSDTTSEKKPSPLPVLKVLSEFQVKRSEAVIVGDSNFDIDAGKAAGITTIAVTYGYRPVEAIKHADYMIKSMSELMNILNEQP